MEIFQQLNKKDVKYLVVGGLAVNFHGYSRFTADIDVIIELEDKNIKKIISMLLSFGFKSKLPVNPEDFANSEIRKDWINNKNMKAFNFYKENDIISEFDIVITEDTDFTKKYLRKIEYEIDGVKIPVISIDDLIEMKLIANRSIDKIDIEKLKLLKEIN